MARGSRNFGTSHPFFKPLWIRVAVTLFASGWAIFEFVSGAAFWGVIFGGFAALCVWGFFFDFKPEEEQG